MRVHEQRVCACVCVYCCVFWCRCPQAAIILQCFFASLQYLGALKRCNCVESMATTLGLACMLGQQFSKLAGRAQQLLLTVAILLLLPCCMFQQDLRS